MVTDGPGDVITGRGQAAVVEEEEERVAERSTGQRAGGGGGGGRGPRRKAMPPNHDNFSSPQLHCRVLGGSGGGTCTASAAVATAAG